MNWPIPTHDSMKAKLARARYPGYSHCLRCGMPWAIVKGHSTKYNSHSACFPLCEKCWELLEVPEARIEYYKMLIDHWGTSMIVTEEDKQDIKRAVANGG